MEKSKQLKIFRWHLTLSRKPNWITRNNWRNKMKDKEYGLDINIKKTNILIINKENTPKFTSQYQYRWNRWQVVYDYSYLGHNNKWWEMWKRNKLKNMTGKKHIYQNETHTYIKTIVKQTKTKSNKLLYLLNITIWSRNVDIRQESREENRNPRNVDIQNRKNCMFWKENKQWSSETTKIEERTI
jgi:hypothetical protein